MIEPSEVPAESARQRSELTLEARAIFILGILPRSGTNHVQDLLCLHPSCQRSPIPEDYLTHGAHFLESYASAVTSLWIDGGRAAQDRILQALGSGVVSLLLHDVQRERVVTKTPSTSNLERFDRLFPSARLLILVRDGRAVAESGVRSFATWTYEKAMHWWAREARRILLFCRERSDGGRHMLVRYEALVPDPEPELRRILAFLGLDAAGYDFDAARALPVRGSSSFRLSDGQRVHWEAVERTPDFEPTRRWSGWDRRLHERFNWVAGGPMRELGYGLERFEGLEPLWRLRNLALDTAWRAQSLTTAFRSALRSSWRRNRERFSAAALDRAGHP